MCINVQNSLCYVRVTRKFVKNMVFTCHYCLNSLIWRLQMKFLSLMLMSVCTFIVCFRISAFCCALILCIIPGCQRRGQVPGPEVQHYTHCGPKGSDGLAASSAVRKPGVSRAWDITLRHPTLLGPLGSPPCSTAFPQRAVSAS